MPAIFAPQMGITPWLFAISLVVALVWDRAWRYLGPVVHWISNFVLVTTFVTSVLFVGYNTVLDGQNEYLLGDCVLECRSNVLLGVYDPSANFFQAVISVAARNMYFPSGPGPLLRNCTVPPSLATKKRKKNATTSIGDNAQPDVDLLCEIFQKSRSSWFKYEYEGSLVVPFTSVEHATCRLASKAVTEIQEVAIKVPIDRRGSFDANPENRRGAEKIPATAGEDNEGAPVRYDLCGSDDVNEWAWIHLMLGIGVKYKIFEVLHDPSAALRKSFSDPFLYLDPFYNDWMYVQEMVYVVTRLMVRDWTSIKS
jgi:hypothetical protein